MRQGTLVTAPTEEPVDLATLKSHMRVTIPDDDALIAATYLTAARQYVEEAYDRALITQTWDYPLDVFPWMSQSFDLPVWPLQSVTSITYTDSNNNPVVWPSSNYFVDAVRKPGRVLLAVGQGWPSVSLRAANGVVIRYVAGYGDHTTVPYTTKLAILLLAEHWYEFREPIMAQRGVNPIEVPFTVRALLGTSEVAGVS